MSRTFLVPIGPVYCFANTKSQSSIYILFCNAVVLWYRPRLLLWTDLVLLCEELCINNKARPLHTIHLRRCFHLFGWSDFSPHDSIDPDLHSHGALLGAGKLIPGVWWLKQTPTTAPTHNISDQPITENTVCMCVSESSTVSSRVRVDLLRHSIYYMYAVLWNH